MIGHQNLPCACISIVQCRSAHGNAFACTCEHACCLRPDRHPSNIRIYMIIGQITSYVTTFTLRVTVMILFGYSGGNDLGRGSTPTDTMMPRHKLRWLMRHMVSDLFIVVDPLRCFIPASLTNMQWQVILHGLAIKRAVAWKGVRDMDRKYLTCENMHQGTLAGPGNQTSGV